MSLAAIKPAHWFDRGDRVPQREGKERGYEAWALRLLGEIASRRHPPDIEQATTHYRQAIGLAKELVMRPLVAHCHLGLGNLFRRTGDRAKAEEHLAGAKVMYREMSPLSRSY